MKDKKQRCLGILGVFFSSFLISILASVNVNAAIPSNISTINQKAAFEGIWQCFAGGKYSIDFEASGGYDAFVKPSGGSGEYVKLPYHTTDAGDNNASCKQVLQGFGDNQSSSDQLNQGIMNETARKASTASEVARFFSGSDGKGSSGTMGYLGATGDNVDTGQKTYKLKISLKSSEISCYASDGTPGQNSKFVNIVTGEEFSTLTFPAVTEDKDGNWFWGDAAVAGDYHNTPEVGDVFNLNFCDNNTHFTIIRSDTSNYEVNFAYYSDGGTDPAYGPGTGYIMASKDGWGVYGALFDKYFTYTIEEGTVTDQNVNDFSKWNLTFTGTDYTRPIKKLSDTSTNGYKINMNSYSSLALTDQEVYDLYKYYIDDVFQAHVACEGDAKYELYASEQTINYAKGKNCKIARNSPTIVTPVDKVYGVNSANHFVQEVTLDDIIAKLATTDLEKIDTGEGGNVEDPGDSDSGTTPDQEDNCYTNAGSLGWIVCPLIDATGDFVGQAYAGFIEPALQIEPELFRSDSDNTTYQAWAVFRNIANIIFIILLLVVIFSQLTGIGIDNYGIKKILPKLIIGAILINLSYIICQGAIDLAAIVGNGIGSFMENLGSSMTISGEVSVDTGGTSGAVKVPETAVQSFFSSGSNLAIIGVVGIFTAAAFLSVGWTVIIPVLIALLSVAITIIALIVILGVRQAVAVLLVVVSPVALVCYMLPNTKKIFDKWFNFFKGLLLAYPIASALIYGGDLASKILVGASSKPISTSTWLLVVAAAISIVPIFYIPQVIFKSMGAISGAIGAMSAKLSGSAGKFVNNRPFAQDLRERQELKKSGLKFDKNGNIIGRSMRGRLQDGLSFGTASKARIQRQRQGAIGLAASRAATTKNAGDVGVKTMMQRQMAENIKQEEQDVQNEIAAMGMAGADHAGFNTDSMLDEFNKFNEQIAQGTFNEATNGVRYKALASKLVADGGQGRKGVMQALEGRTPDGKSMINGGNGQGRVAAAISNYASTGDSKIMSSIGSKDAYQEGYMKYVAGLSSDQQANAMKFDDWLEADSGNGVSNLNNITSEVLDKNDVLMSQSGPAFQRALNVKDEDGNYLIDNNRRQDLATNPTYANSSKNVAYVRSTLPSSTASEPTTDSSQSTQSSNSDDNWYDGLDILQEAHDGMRREVQARNQESSEPKISNARQLERVDRLRNRGGKS